MSPSTNPTYTPISSTDDVDIDVEAQLSSPIVSGAAPPAYTPSTPTPRDAAAALTLPTFSPRNPPAKPKSDAVTDRTQGLFMGIWTMVFFLYNMLMAIMLTTPENGGGWVLGYLGLIFLPLIVMGFWSVWKWHRLPKEERERRTRIADLRKMIDKIKRLNGDRTVVVGTEMNIEREQELVEMLYKFPEDEEWAELARDYENVRTEQEGRGWVFRPARVVAAGAAERSGPATAAAGAELMENQDDGTHVWQGRVYKGDVLQNASSEI